MSINAILASNPNFIRPLDIYRGGITPAAQPATTPRFNPFSPVDTVEWSQDAQMAAAALLAASHETANSAPVSRDITQSTISEFVGVSPDVDTIPKNVQAPQVAVSPARNTVTPVIRKERQEAVDTAIARHESTDGVSEYTSQDITSKQVSSRYTPSIVTYNPFRPITSPELLGVLGQRIDLMS